MKKRIRSMTVMLLAAVAMVAMVSTSAFAQYPPAPGLSVACSRAAPVAQPIVCSVVGARGGERLTVSASASPAFYTEELTANSDGEAGFRFTPPRDVRDRVITVSVVGEFSGEIVATEIAPITPGRSGEAPGRTGQAPGLLARTGQDTLLLGAAGLILLTGGLLAFRRRKVDVDA
jgi:LPXTG-motif cell wall-anchored protein